MISTLAAIGAIAVAQAPWKTYPLAPLRMSISLPFKPVARKFNIKQNDSNIVSSTWYTGQSGNFNVTLTFTQFKSGSKVNVNGAMDGAIQGLKQSRSVANFKTNSKPISVSGVPGLKMIATFTDSGEKVVYEALILGKGTRLWQIMTTYAAEPNYSSMAKRTLSGAQVRP